MLRYFLSPKVQQMVHREKNLKLTQSLTDRIFHCHAKEVKGKYDYLSMADLLFDWFGFSCFAYV